MPGHCASLGPYEQKLSVKMAVARKLLYSSDLEVFDWDFGRFGDSIPGYRYGASKGTVYFVNPALFGHSACPIRLCSHRIMC